MIIGTPFTKSSLRVLLLGSGEIGKEIVFSLQRLGCEVTAASSYPKAPAQQTAQKSITADLSDPDQLLHIVHQEKPDIIIVSELGSIAYEVLSHIEKVGLSRVIPSSQALDITTNREKMRKLAVEELGLVTSAYDFANSYDELLEVVKNKIGYPCIIKPTTSFSGTDQTVVSSEEDLLLAWSKSQSSSSVIVESFLEVDNEITVLTIRHQLPNGQFDVGFCDPVGQIKHNGNFHESWQPADISPKALERTHHFARLIVDRLGGIGLFGVEFFVRGEEVWFSEVRPSPHNSGLVTLCSQYQSEFDLHVRAALSLPVDLQLREPGASHAIVSPVEAEDVVYDNIYTALSYPKTNIIIFGEPRSCIGKCIGIALATGKNTDEARFAAMKSAKSIEIKKSTE
ncbi:MULTISPECIES: formate-dependent phosphoribosylglycinamide formyltransferase [Candidatus Ichthyocystis]|uniref:Phosphoribosylglycinamide formyltransferase 2 n=1 Tax=Candidatus Ichthyocystis hellenicum TaxID=1561003 RepID=A0A0S4M1I6_9BURK|nr:MULTISPECIES: formate-dependent phosphoribosylglycinamide formyltransferase [Ichthyocystis]CUT17489.1 Phosphoribosylglycinamide formyltransferase 2 [Candidatus Ichthyocystis hellenicum]